MRGLNIWSLRMFGTPARGECEACGRVRLFTADELRATGAAEHDFVPLGYLGGRMRCTSCGARGIALGIDSARQNKG